MWLKSGGEMHTHSSTPLNLVTIICDMNSIHVPASSHWRGYTHIQCISCATNYPVCVHTWVIKVELALICLGFLLWSEHPVEAVLAEDHHLTLVVIDLVLAQQLHDLLTY